MSSPFSPLKCFSNDLNAKPFKRARRPSEVRVSPALLPSQRSFLRRRRWALLLVLVSKESLDPSLPAKVNQRFSDRLSKPPASPEEMGDGVVGLLLSGVAICLSLWQRRYRRESSLALRVCSGVFGEDLRLYFRWEFAFQPRREGLAKATRQNAFRFSLCLSSNLRAAHRGFSERRILVLPPSPSPPRRSRICTKTTQPHRETPFALARRLPLLLLRATH